MDSLLMRWMRNGLPTMAPAMQSHHSIILLGGSAEITARGISSGEGGSRARITDYIGKFHAIIRNDEMGPLRELA
jgi:hypothetical protein